MTEKPLFSVIIPVYNGERYLDEAVQSVLDQTFQNWELIIVDDGSEDNSFEIALAYSKKDPRIKVLQHEGGINKGVSASRNLGITEARGAWIALLDADDIWFKNKLEVNAHIVTKHKKVALIYSKAVVRTENYSGQVHTNIYNYGTPGLTKEPFLKTLKGFPAATTSMVINKNIFRKVGGFNAQLTYAEDTLFYHQALYYGDLYYIDEPLLYIRYHDGSCKNNIKPSYIVRSRLTVYLYLLETEAAYKYREQISYHVVATGMYKIWRYFFRQPVLYFSEPGKALYIIFRNKKVLLKHKILAVFLPFRILSRFLGKKIKTT